jgi:phage-related protein
MEDGEQPFRELIWVGSSKRDFMGFPQEVRAEMGYGLYRAQQGREHASAKALKGFGGRAVLELVEDHPGGTHRAAYTVRFESAVYVLHAFQKKSKRGIATPQLDKKMIERRLREAEAIHRSRRDAARGGQP